MVRYAWVLIFLCSFIFPLHAEPRIELSEQRQAELMHLLKQDCGSCHGMTLKGGLGPALSPELMAQKSRQMMLDTIRHGRPGTPMPPWSPILKQHETEWLIETLYKGTAYEP